VQEAWIAAHHAWLRRGEAERAARCASWQALGLFFRGDLAPAMGWVARGGRLLEESRRDGVERAWLRMLTALPRLFEGDADVYASFSETGEIAERLSDADASMFARLGRGYSLILEGRVGEGLALPDDVMLSVTADEVAPMLAGIAYFQVIALCEAVFDLRRSREWMEALTRWCDSQPDLVPFRGNCLVHRCEIFQLQGAGIADLQGLFAPCAVSRAGAGRGSSRVCGSDLSSRGTDSVGASPAALLRLTGGGASGAPAACVWELAGRRRMRAHVRADRRGAAEQPAQRAAGSLTAIRSSSAARRTFWSKETTEALA
jgi:hypothetical protein